MTLPHGVTPVQVMEACQWGFLARILARRRAASGSARDVVLLLARETYRGLVQLARMPQDEAVKQTVALLARATVVVEVARG